MSGKVIAIIEAEIELVYGKDTINVLSSKNVSEFDRGVLRGKIEALNRVHALITKDTMRDAKDMSNEAKTVRSTLSRRG